MKALENPGRTHTEVESFIKHLLSILPIFADKDTRHSDDISPADRVYLMNGVKIELYLKVLIGEFK